MFLANRLAAALLAAVIYMTPSVSSALAVIVVTPSAVEQPRAQSPVPVTVIEQEDIEKSNARNVSELLRSQAGLQISDYYGDGSTATVDLRGFGPTAGSNTLILLDGRRLNRFSDSAPPDLSQIELDDVERIEILQGSGGVLYGNQAVGGVVNIIRKQRQQAGSMAELSLGSYSASEIKAGIDRYIGNTLMELQVADRQSDNYRDHNEVDRQDLNVRLSRQHDSFKSFVELDSSRSDLQAPGALLQAEVDADREQSLSFYENDYFNTDTDLLRVGFDKPIGGDGTLHVAVAREETEREFLNTFRPFTGSVTTQDRATSSLTTRYARAFVLGGVQTQWVAGLDWQKTDYELVSTMGEQLMDQSVAELYLSTDWMLSEHGSLQIGARVSEQDAEVSDQATGVDNESFDDSVSVLSLGYTHRLSDLKLFLRADQNYRYPTVEEHTNVPFGDAAGLQTQEGLSLELGAELQVDSGLLRGTLYRIDLDNEIGFDSSGFANLNLDQTQREGVLFEWLQDWNDDLSTQISLTLLNAEITDGAFKGNILPLVAERQVRVSADYRFSERYSQRVEVVATGEQVFAGDFANELDKLPAYEVVNWALTYDKDAFRVALRVNNLLDEEYSETGAKFSDYSTFPAVDYEAYYPAPGRNFWLTLSWRI